MTVMLRPRRLWDNLTKWQQLATVLWPIVMCLFILRAILHKPYHQGLFESWRQGD